MAKEVSPGVLALRKVVEDVYADARKAKAEGKPVGWSSSKFPCELAAAFDLNIVYPENQAAGIAAAQALRTGTALPELPIRPLQQALEASGVILHFDDAWLPAHPEQDPLLNP